MTTIRTEQDIYQRGVTHGRIETLKELREHFNGNYDIASWLDAYREVDRQLQALAVPCTVCNGDGVKEVATAEINDDGTESSGWIDLECEHCNGTGKEP